QAEDGIRDYKVTGVQTCALPISRNPSDWGFEMGDVTNAYVDAATTGGLLTLVLFLGILWQSFRALGIARKAAERDRKSELMLWRSEERRVGKECRSGG